MLTRHVLSEKENKSNLKTEIWEYKNMIFSPLLGVPQWPVSLHVEGRNFHEKGAKELFQKQETFLV